MDDPTNPLPPHIIVFPSPIQSSITTIFDLSELLSLSGLHVTFLLIPYTNTLLLRHFHLDSRLNPYPTIQLHTISDGLPPDQSPSDAEELLNAMETMTKPVFRDLLTSGRLSSDDQRGPVTCIISDGFMTFVYDVADEIRVPVVAALSSSPSSIWALSNLPNPIPGASEGSDSIGGNNVDSAMKSVPGMDGILISDDLASMCRSHDSAHNLRKQINELSRAHGLILNTFKALDGPLVSPLRSICSTLYPIGPIHAHLGVRQETQKMTPLLNYSVEENNNCIKWLDMQPPKSVLYVNIENQEQLKWVQTLELWHGLVNSGKRFLWVRPPEFKLGDGRVPPKIVKATKERGCIVDMASNVQVLAHRAIGGFLTRGRWDSIVQGIAEGVPVICCPSSLDQQVNSRFVSKEVKIGLDVEGRWERSVIGKTIRDVIELESDLIYTANKMKNLGRKSVRRGGSSYASWDSLIDDIRFMQP